MRAGRLLHRSSGGSRRPAGFVPGHRLGPTSGRGASRSGALGGRAVTVSPRGCGGIGSPPSARPPSARVSSRTGMRAAPWLRVEGYRVEVAGDADARNRLAAGPAGVLRRRTAGAAGSPSKNRPLVRRYSTDRAHEHFRAAPRLVLGLQQRGVQALTSLTRARLWACAPADSQQDPDLAVLVRQLARYCESELSLNSTSQGDA